MASSVSGRPRRGDSAAATARATSAADDGRRAGSACNSCITMRSNARPYAAFIREGGANALGLDSWPETAVDVNHPQLAGVEDWRSALVAACSADALRTPS